jgi:hypothetical protein
MRCPICENVLEVTHQDRYESLDEHVSSSLPSLKDGYQCMYRYCIANNFNAVWIKDGDLFLDPIESISSVVAHDVIKKLSITGLPYALDSWNNTYHLFLTEQTRRTKTFNFKKIEIKIIPKYKQVYIENDKISKYKKLPFRYKIELYKHTSDNCKFIITPFYVSIKWKLNKFENGYINLIENENKEQSYRRYMFDFFTSVYTPSTKIDHIVSFYIKIFKKTKYDKVLRMYNGGLAK